VIRNYIKTSGRNLLRNKLFSSINIAGLAISMLVSLLLIVFVLDLSSYDKFDKDVPLSSDFYYFETRVLSI